MTMLHDHEGNAILAPRTVQAGLAENANIVVTLAE